MHRSRCPKFTGSPTKRKDRIPYIRIFASVLFSISSIAIADAFVANNQNKKFHSRCIETKQQKKKQQFSTVISFLSPTTAVFGRYSSLSSSPSSRDSECDSSSSSSKDSYLLSSNDLESQSSLSPSKTSYNPDTATTYTTSNVTSSATYTAVAGFDSSTKVDTGNRSRKQERQRFDAEIEEAFAKQTRENNPLLGVKSIGVDYGLVRTGVAVTIGYNPEALDVIVTDHPLLRDDEAEGMSEEEVAKEEEKRLEIQRAKVTEKVIQIALREKADRIVVGLPLHKNGTEAHQTTLSRKFACDHLAIATLRTLGPGVTVHMCDERYTSKEAAARMRSQNSQYSGKGNNNNDLYGLLDGESAKIILEQYYDDHLDRYSSRSCSKNDDNNENSDSEAKTKIADPGYNGEIVTIPDADLVEELTHEYNEKRRLQREQLTSERNDRDSRAKSRKLAIEQDRIRAKKKLEEDAAKGITTPKKKKRKRKRK